MEIDYNILEGPNERLACAIVVDTSGSMQGAKIEELNRGLRAGLEVLQKDAFAGRRVETAIITFGGQPSLERPFTLVSELEPPTLKADGGTPMGAGIELAIDEVEKRWAWYRQHDTRTYRPIVMLLTDGQPTDGERWRQAAEKVHRGHAERRFLFWAVGVQGADLDVLRQIAPAEAPPRMLDGLKFVELFQWLSRSMTKITQSRMGSAVKLEPTDTWAQITV